MRNVLFRPPLAPPWITLRDSDARAYIKAVEMADGQSLPVSVKRAIYLFIAGCKADGIWSQIKSACILCGASTLSGALMPLIGTAPTNFNFVSADYDRKTGLIGDGSTKYLDANRNNNADPQNSNHNAVFVSTASTVAGVSAYLASSSGSAGANNLAINTTLNEFFSRNRNATAFAVATAARTGFAAHNRSNSVQFAMRVSGTTTTLAATSDPPTNEPINVFRRGTSNYSNGRLAFYSIGESIDVALLDSRVTSLINAIQAAIP